MKSKRLCFLLLLFCLAIAGICVYSFLQYTDSFEMIVPYEHGFSLSEPDESIWLDVNTATASQLTKIPGMSRSLAEKITEYRREIGGFSSLTELRDVPDIPDSLFSTLGNYLYLTPRAEREETETYPSPTEQSSAMITETAVSATEPTTELLLDLNTASVEELCLLPGIGESIAAEIVEYRRKIGKFVDRNQLLAVKGIGEVTLSRISEHLCIEDEQPLQHEETNAATDPPEIPIININTATAQQLLVLPHCTEELAENVIYLREHIHGFVNILEVLYTEGITDEIYISWEPYLAVDDEGNTQIKKPDSP